MSHPPGRCKSAPVPMDRTAERRPCLRCGVYLYPSARSKTVAGMCRDCRSADPAFVVALTTDQPVPPTTDAEYQRLLQDDLAERVTA